MKELTAKQQRIWDLKQSGKTRKEIASELGISEPVVSKQISTCHKKLGVKTTGTEGGAARALENSNPEKAAAVIDALSDPALAAKIRTMEEACAAAGLPKAAHGAVIKRMLVRYGKPIQAARDIKTADLTKMLDDKIWLASQFMDEYAMSNASFRDLALGTTAMIEKRQLLRGEPTQIVSDHERKKLNELAPLVIEEFKRRGITVDGTVTEKTVTPA